MLREFRELIEENPELERYGDCLKEIYEKASAAEGEPPDKKSAVVKEPNSERELGACINQQSNKKCCEGFAAKLERARPFLFTGVIYPEMSLHNNHAERVLRKIVVHRKTMRRIRNEKGKRFIDNKMSALHTWRQQGLNVYEKLKEYAA